jgi:hypothetical protein
MRGRKSQVVVELSDEQRVELKGIARSRSVKAGVQKRARAVLAIADGMTFRQARSHIGMTDRNLRKWCRRYLDEGIDGLNDREGRGRKPVFPLECRGAGRQTCV